MVMDLELASAVSAAQQADEKSTAIAHRTRHHRSLHVRIAGNHRPVAIIPFPGDIAIMVVVDQNRPLLAPARDAVRDDFAAVFYAGVRGAVRPKT